MPEAHEWVSRDKVIAIIAERIRSLYPGNDFREVKDKVGKRLAYAVNEAKKNRLEPPVKGRHVFGDVVRWARTIPRWGAKLVDLPQTAAPQPPLVRVRGEHLARYGALPSSWEECEDLLLKTMDQLQACHDELSRLRPQAEKWRQFMATRTKGQKKSSGGK